MLEKKLMNILIRSEDSITRPSDLGNQMKKLVRFSSKIILLMIIFSVPAVAQRQIGSAASSAVGVVSASECTATIYTTSDCVPCNALKNRIASNPAKYGCNTITWIDCGSYRNLSPYCKSQGVTSVPKPFGKICDDCDSRNPVSPPPPPPAQDNPPASGQPDNDDKAPCKGEAKHYCKWSDDPKGYSCCIHGCDPANNNRCVSCSGYSRCTPSSCASGLKCVNKRDQKGCPQDFVCEDPSATRPPNKPVEEAPYGGDGEGYCDAITGKCYPSKPSEPASPEQPQNPNTEQPAEPKSPVKPEPAADPSPVNPQPVVCDNPCPNDQDANNCCKPTEGCYQGRCNAYQGCSGCVAGQSCVPIDRAPWYGCFSKKPNGGASEIKQ